MELLPGMMNSGSVLGDFATTNQKGRFFRNRTGELVADAFPDEQVLFVQTEKGLSVISGCMHAGILSTIKKVKSLYPQEPLYALVGGFHLDSATLGEFAEFVESAVAAGFQKLMPLHCSGDAFIEYVQKQYPELFLEGKAGSRILL